MWHCFINCLFTGTLCIDTWSSVLLPLLRSLKAAIIWTHLVVHPFFKKKKEACSQTQILTSLSVFRCASKPYNASSSIAVNDLCNRTNWHRCYEQRSKKFSIVTKESDIRLKLTWGSADCQIDLVWLHSEFSGTILILLRRPWAFNVIGLMRKFDFLLRACKRTLCTKYALRPHMRCRHVNHKSRFKKRRLHKSLWTFQPITEFHMYAWKSQRGLGMSLTLHSHGT